MTFAQKEKPEGGESYITVTHGMSGFFAAMVQLNTEDSDPRWHFYEPWTSGMGRHEDADPANVEAQRWAEYEGMTYVPAYVGWTGEQKAAHDANVSKNFRKRIARVRQLRATNQDMSLAEAVKQAKQEIPE